MKHVLKKAAINFDLFVKCKLKKPKKSICAVCSLLLK